MIEGILSEWGILSLFGNARFHKTNQYFLKSKENVFGILFLPLYNPQFTYI